MQAQEPRYRERNMIAPSYEGTTGVKLPLPLRCVKPAKLECLIPKAIILRFLAQSPTLITDHTARLSSVIDTLLWCMCLPARYARRDYMADWPPKHNLYNSAQHGFQWESTCKITWPGQNKAHVLSLFTRRCLCASLPGVYVVGTCSHG